MVDLQVKRGRPKKLSNQEIFVLRNLNKNRKYQDYNVLYNEQRQYIDENYTQNLKRMLFKITVLTSFTKEAKMSPLEHIIEEAAKFNMISEIEVVLASLYLKKYYDEFSDLSVDELINSVFYFAKSELETDQKLLETLKTNLENKFNNLSTTLSYLTKLGPVTLQEINKQYKILSEVGVKNINYLYYIDEILRKSPPYTKNVVSLKKKIPSKGKEQKESPEEIKKFRKFKDFSDIQPLSQSDLEILNPDEFTDCDTHYNTGVESLSDKELDLLLDLN